MTRRVQSREAVRLFLGCKQGIVVANRNECSAEETLVSVLERTKMD